VLAHASCATTRQNFIIEVARLSNVALLNLFRTSDTPVFLTSRRISRLFLYSLRPDN